MNKIKVTVIEDQGDIAANLADILMRQDDIELLSVNVSAEEALKDVDNGIADVYLVDLGLPGMCGVDFIRLMISRGVKSAFVVHTISENSRDLTRALAAGAAGYILKGCSDKELVEDIKLAASGRILLISPRMAMRIVHIFKGVTDLEQQLTKSEIDILYLLKTALKYEEIAEKKHISLSTVQSHIKNIYKKLDVNNRHDAVTKGAVLGLIH